MSQHVALARYEVCFLRACRQVCRLHEIVHVPCLVKMCRVRFRVGLGSGRVGLRLGLVEGCVSGTVAGGAGPRARVGGSKISVQLGPPVERLEEG